MNIYMRKIHYNADLYYLHIAFMFFTLKQANQTLKSMTINHRQISLLFMILGFVRGPLVFTFAFQLPKYFFFKDFLSNQRLNCCYNSILFQPLTNVISDKYIQLDISKKLPMLLQKWNSKKNWMCDNFWTSKQWSISSRYSFM